MAALSPSLLGVRRQTSIWEYLLDPFCRLPASEVVYGTDRSTDTKKYYSNPINGPAVRFFVDTHGSNINVSTFLYPPTIKLYFYRTHFEEDYCSAIIVVL